MINDVKPLPDNVLVTEMDHGSKKVNGIILLDDNGNTTGIRPRWAKVYAVGENIKDLKVGQYVLVEHGRWTYRVKVDNDGDERFIQQIDYPSGVLVVTDKNPSGDVEYLG